jgi:hypothetical protein
MDRRVVLVEESFDHCLSNGVGTLADSIDLVIAQVDRFLPSSSRQRSIEISSFCSPAGNISPIATHSTSGQQFLWVSRSGRRGMCRDVPVQLRG